MTTIAAVPVAAAPATNGAAAPQTPAAAAPAPTDGKTPVAPKPLTPAQKIKLKLKGKNGEAEREYTPAELERELQIAEHERGSRAQHLKERQDFEARQRKLQEDPDAFFQEAGIDVEAIIEQRRVRAEQMKRLTPEQLKLHAAEEKLAKYEAEKAKADEAAKVAAEQAEHDSFVQGNAKLFRATMALAGLDKGSPFDKGSYLHSMGQVRQMALVAGEPDLTPEQLHAHTERFENTQFANTLARKLKNPEWCAKNAESLQAVARAVLPALEGDALLGFVGKENAIRFVKALNGKMRTSPTPIVQEPPPVETNGNTTVKPSGKTEWDIMDALGS